MKLREALALAEEIGFAVQRKRRHGEWKILRPGLPALVVNGQRVDAPKNLVMQLRRAQGRRGTGWRSSR